MHEIVTLQFGQRANYLATHFWNIQESYFTYTPDAPPSIIDHDINFRPGIGTDGSDTYTPRTIIYDLKGGFGTLKQQNALYEDTHSSQRFDGTKIWNDNGLTTIKQQQIHPIPYQQNLDAGLPTAQLHKSQVRYWSDFNRVYFHPRSIVQLNEYSLNSSIAPFENWNAGEELFRDVDREADLLDRDVRPFVEECDSMQGFQVFTGADDAWGGWTSRYIDALRDEYGKKSTWVYGIEDNRQAQRDKVIAKKANAARTLVEMAKSASVYTMLGTRPSSSPAYLTCDYASEWEVSALMATAIESATLPTRLRSTLGSTQQSTLPQYEQFISSEEGRNIWQLGLSINHNSASPQNDHGNGATYPSSNMDTRTRNYNSMQSVAQPAEDIPINTEPTKPDISFTPSASHLLPSTTTTRQQHLPTIPSHTFTQLTTHRSHHPTSTNNLPSQLLPPDTLLRLRLADLPMIQSYSVPLSFPFTSAYPSSLFTFPTDNLTLTSSLTTSTTTKRTLMDLRDLVTRFNRGIAVEEREDLYNEVTGVAEGYTFGGESDGEDDWGSGEE